MSQPARLQAEGQMLSNPTAANAETKVVKLAVG